jgi:tetratricopeptide (TPR) repeat protein
MLRPTIAFLAAEVDTTAGGLTTKYSSPSSIEAFGRVNVAWQHFFASPRDTVSVFAELDTAFRIDSSYALPLLMKAYMLDVKSQWAGVEEMVRRVAPLEPEMSKLERAALDLFRADLRGDALARVGIARRLHVLSPGSAEMPLLRVVSALYVGNVAEALTALGETDPTRGMNLVAPTYLEWASVAYHHAGSASLEERAVREELKRFKHHPPATYGLARVYAADNDSRLSELLEDGIPPARDPNDVRDPALEWYELRMFAGRELRAHGYGAEAQKIFTEVVDAIQSGSQRYAPLLEARAFYDAGQFDAARAAFTQILAADSGNVEAMGRLGAIATRAGDLTTARQMDDRLKRVRQPYLMGAPLRYRAAIAMAAGQTDEAVDLLEMAVRQGMRLLDSPPNLTIHLDPDFVGVEKTAAYKAMVQALAEASASK